ncbi:potassium-transporting ATPase subunit KdpA [Gorillibacterium timonense]|uniref:potassium-transporting ATPase subunit KdpA n=1 Tax=Gorillibacterium timonense TaxID=1689269 RepID=UPI00071E1EE5|nr:potassium-transporting ATPase subunit KdpA [Gorillibacterium timonense]
MKMIVLQDAAFLLLLIGLSIPLGRYMYRVMTGEKVLLTKILSPVERALYRLMGVKPEEEMTAWRYALSVLLFSGVGLIAVWVLELLQRKLPFNPEHIGAMSMPLAFNTAASFVSNTNWQAYSGESAMSYLTQALGLTVQNFVSAAAGIAVLFALIRGFLGKTKGTLGSFWCDLVRVTLYVLIPLSTILALILVSQGVVQSFDSYKAVAALENGARQLIPLGPAASQIAIKQLGTNGGGFFGANSAYPLENPTVFSNLLELLSILLLPAALCVSFGVAVKDRKQGRTLYTVMLILFIAALAVITLSEQGLGPVYSGVSAGGSMEGKEIIHGVGTSSLWATATTAASNGSVNAMHDSFTPLSGMMMLFLMQLGEIVFGGVGSGLYGMIAFVVLTVFIAGLMVGRTPEYLGKKIEPFDMKMVCLIVLTPPLLTLLGTAVAVSLPQAPSWLANPGPHGFTEILYAFTSLAGNNGSAFAGYAANTAFTNIAGGLIMLIARFVPLTAVLLLAGNLGGKKTVAASDGTLPTTGGLFVGMLLGVILLVGALSFLPALALGPIADYFTSIH